MNGILVNNVWCTSALFEVAVKIDRVELQGKPMLPLSERLKRLWNDIGVIQKCNRTGYILLAAKHVGMSSICYPLRTRILLPRKNESQGKMVYKNLNIIVYQASLWKEPRSRKDSAGLNCLSSSISAICTLITFDYTLGFRKDLLYPGYVGLWGLRSR